MLIDFLKANSSWLPILISMLALIVSSISLYKQRIDYSHKFAPNLYPSRNIILTDGNDADGYGDCLIGNLNFVNLSNFDISFFELEAYDVDNKINLKILTRNKIFPTLADRHVLEVNGEIVKVLKIPDASFGVFKSKSNTYLDFVIFPLPETKNIRLDFSIPKRSFLLSDKYLKGFKQLGIYYDVSEWKSFIDEKNPKDYK